MTVVCSSVKDTVINNSELSPKFFTAPEQRHPDGVLSRPSCNTCSREHITAGDSNTALTTTTPSCHTTQIRILGTNNPYTGHSTSNGHQSPVGRVGRGLVVVASSSAARRFPRAHTPRIAGRPAGGAGLSGVGRHTPRIAERPHTSKEEGSVVRMGDGFGLGRVGQVA